MGRGLRFLPWHVPRLFCQKLALRLRINSLLLITLCVYLKKKRTQLRFGAQGFVLAVPRLLGAHHVPFSRIAAVFSQGSRLLIDRRRTLSVAEG